MPRRTLLTTIQLETLLAFDERDLSIIRQRRGAHNRLGFAVQLCYLRYPDSCGEYAQRDETRREHALELQAAFDYRSFTAEEYRQQRGMLTELALQTNKAMVIAQQLIEILRKQYIILPPVRVIDRLCAEALARGTRLLYQRLIGGLNIKHHKQLDKFLTLCENMRTIP